ncbi:MAG: hypothetical protein KGJ88_08345 [Verrucomicrobiota bacterium]|nr:hypothetical protein [Verrucomicrobiota bacterium]
MKPDVVMKAGRQTILFRPQNHEASQWLHQRCGLDAENIRGDTEIRVHPEECERIIAELKAAGFAVASERDAL